MLLKPNILQIVVLLLTVLLSTMFDTSQVQAASDRPLPKSVADYMRPGAGTYRNLFLPLKAPLQVQEIELWAEILSLSDAQRQFVEFEFERFIREMNNRMDEIIPQYLLASEELSEVQASAGVRSEEYLKAIGENLLRRNDLVRHLREVEEAYIYSLIPVLTREQLPDLEVINARAERKWYCSDSLPTRGADLDLYEMWLSLDRSSVDQVVRAEIAESLGRHDVALTGLYRQVEREHHRRLIRFRRDMLRVSANELAPATFLSRHNQRFERRARLGRLIREAIISTADSIADKLTMSARAQWRKSVKERLFPELYPDPTSLNDIFAAIRDDQQLDASSRSRAWELFGEYDHSSKTLNDKLEVYVIAWGDRAARGEDGFQRQLLSGDLDVLLEDRVRHGQETLERLRSVVGADALQRHAGLLPNSLGRSFDFDTN